uniref:Uncharacterized protein n=1 Tax=Eptatretus burgeri TaxID=7764 RepID=A0A8C4PZX9_EPTBU
MPGISPSGHPGMFMLQLSLPGGSHPTRPPSPPRRCQRRGYSLEQRPPRVCELPRSESLNQCSPRLVSPLASPSQSPSSTPHLNSHPGVLSFPLAPTAIPRPPTSSQGDRSFPLLGASLQYVPSPSCPNSTVTLQQTTNRAGGRVKRPPRKAFSEDSSSVDPDFFRSSMLEVDLPAGVPRAEAEALLAKLGGKVRWVHAQLPNDSVSPNSTHPDGDTSPNPSDETTVATPGASVRDLRLVALFPTRQLAQVALSKLGLGPGTATNGFRLRPGGTRRCNEAFPTPERASSH